MKKKLSIKTVLICLIMICLPIIVFADDEISLEITSSPEYTESYKKWLELPEDEKSNYIEPQMYESIEENNFEIQTYSSNENIVGATNLPKKYQRSYYGAVKNQGRTDTCWAFSSATAFETNYYYTNSVKKEFSPLHMEYATSKKYNTNGFNRTVNSGGNFNIALAYATNGMGLVTSSSVGNQAITSSLISQLKSTQKVSDYIELKGESQIKNYIYKYGVVPVYTYFDTQYFSSETTDYNKNLAYCCNRASELLPNHAVTLVGWDDDYTNSVFSSKKGAYLALNSYGTAFGDNGLYHIFYDDIFVNETVYGITQTNDIEYDYIYQYDQYGCVSEVSMNTSVYAANVFKRQTSQTNEQLTEISLYLPNTQSVRVYVNTSGSDISISNATTSFTTGILNAGYHTVKLSTPLTLTGNQFSVIVKYATILPIERSVDSSSSWCYTVTSNNGESYISADGKNYVDLQDFMKSELEIKYSNACIKAFTKKIGQTTRTTTQNSSSNTNNSSKTNINYSQNKSDLEKYLFDYKYYAEHNLDLYNVYGYDELALKNHWNKYGKAEGRKASSIFDARYYVENNADLSVYRNNYVGAYNHFVNYGYAEFRKSSLEYDGSYYKSHNGDLANMSSMELIRHYALYGKNELRQANTNYDIVNYLFDANVYAKFNPDVAYAYGSNSSKLKEHWYKYGISEGRVASLVFDAKSYLRINSDVARAYSSTNYVAAYNHFINYGFAEGRQGNSIFSVKYYLNNNSDIRNAYGNNYLRALNHFILYGKNEPRATSATFNISKYKAKNRDLSNAFANKYFLYFEHYIMYGQNERRTCL